MGSVSKFYHFQNQLKFYLILKKIPSPLHKTEAEKKFPILRCRFLIVEPWSLYQLT